MTENKPYFNLHKQDWERRCDLSQIYHTAWYEIIAEMHKYKKYEDVWKKFEKGVIIKQKILGEYSYERRKVVRFSTFKSLYHPKFQRIISATWIIVTMTHKPLIYCVSEIFIE